MAELLLELYSEEIPPQLQIAARSQIKQFIEKTFEEENVKYKELLVFSSPTRLTLFIKDLSEKVKTKSKEIKGPKLGSPKQVIQGLGSQIKNVGEGGVRNHGMLACSTVFKIRADHSRYFLTLFNN